MFAGSLDRRIAWQTAVITRGAEGNEVKAWSTSFETWACLAGLTGAEVIQAGENVDERTVKIQIRYRPNLKTVDRFEYEDRNYRVHSINEIGRKVGLKIVGRTRADGLAVTG
jgi:SPP1 family predicted phage head-tail adaptor